ncbi:SCO2400 family protein, partial [Streptomyces boluensis]|nr:hypothetical protein [Streptomyces boluensis]
MDYCHPCRRHLNGALACPGCGTPAEACRRYAAERAAAEDAAGTEAQPDEPRAPGRSRRAAGRARRRDTERRRRRRTRALVLGAGFLLVAGGIGAAQLSADTAPSDRAAPAQPDDSTGPTQTATESDRADRSTRPASSTAPP